MDRYIRLLVLIIIYFLTSCGNQTIDEKKIHNDSLALKQNVDKTDTNINQEEARKFDTIFKQNDIVIIGDPQVNTKKIYSILIKFEPYISFDDYKVDTLFSGNKAKIDYASHPIAREYKTMITYAYNKESMNFAGHYCFATWGCGCPCQGSAIVDLYDGKVYIGVDASLGYDFHKDSKMVIVNPTDSTGYYNGLCPYCKPLIYIWNEKSKKFYLKKTK